MMPGHQLAEYNNLESAAKVWLTACYRPVPTFCVRSPCSVLVCCICVYMPLDTAEARKPALLAPTYPSPLFHAGTCIQHCVFCLQVIKKGKTAAVFCEPLQGEGGITLGSNVSCNWACLHCV